MKFRITASAEKIKKMCDDLDEEIEKSRKIQKTGQFKNASRLVQKIMKMPIILLLNYRRVNQYQIILTVSTSADKFMKLGVIRRQIVRRAKKYGKTVKVEVVKREGMR